MSHDFHLGVPGMHTTSPSFHLGNFQLPQASFDIPSMPMPTFTPMQDGTQPFSLQSTPHFPVATAGELMANVNITTTVAAPHFQQPDLGAGTKTLFQEAALHVTQSHTLGKLSTGVEVAEKLNACAEHIQRDLNQGKGPLETLTCNALEAAVDGTLSFTGSAAVTGTILPLAAFSLVNPAIAPVAFDMTVQNYANVNALAHNAGQAAGQGCHNFFDLAAQLIGGEKK